MQYFLEQAQGLAALDLLPVVGITLADLFWVRHRKDHLKESQWELALAGKLNWHGTRKIIGGSK
jgi:hypothetical protein